MPEVDLHVLRGVRAKHEQDSGDPDDIECQSISCSAAAHEAPARKTAVSNA